MWIRSLGVTVLAVAASMTLAMTASAYSATSLAGELPAPTNTATIVGAASGAGDHRLVNVRTGRHAAFDRTVFDFVGGTPGFRVAYGTLVAGGTGKAISLSGPADLVIVFNPAYAHDLNTGAVLYPMSTVLNPGLPTLRQIKFGEDFEGYVSAGLGLADRVGFRVFPLRSPDRVVVDVAHQPTQPFGFATTWVGDPLADTKVQGVRAGRHPGYDRLVFDLGTARVPYVFVSYRRDTSTLVVGFSGQNVPAVVNGPRTVHVGLPQLRSVAWSVYSNGTASAFITTASRHGFRVMVLYQPTRLVVDVAY